MGPEQHTQPTTHTSKWWKKLLIGGLVIACIAGVAFAGQYIIIQTQAALGYLSDNTIDIISDTFGKPMKTDIHGNVNVLLVGTDIALLTDSIIVASWNPALHSVTMISIPRDLYVDMPDNNIRARINAVLGLTYRRNGGDIHAAIQVLSDQIEEMLGIQTPYYAIVDFDGFKDIIDAIGGIEIDVPERIYDTAYPNDANRGYITFHVERGLQHMDGDTALKYARSRHSTSDFSRSQRQQLIVEATMKQVLRRENIQNLSTIRQLYDEYTNMVTTNISNQEIIGMLRYIFTLEHMFNFGLTSVCSTRGWQLMHAGCFLYTPPRDWFSGASVLVPNGSTFNNIGFYDYIRNFAHIVAQNQEFLIEGARVKIYNGVDRSYAQSIRKPTDGHAGQMATKLRRYGFTIVGADSASEPHEQTKVIIYGDDDYSATIRILERFFSIGEIARVPLEYVTHINDLGEEEMIVQDMGADVVVILGNQYLDERPAQFNFNM